MWRYHQEANQRQVLFHRRHAHAMQLDLCQPCSELAVCSDQETDADLIPEGRLEIVRTAEYRCDTTWHSHYNDGGRRYGPSDRTAETRPWAIPVLRPTSKAAHG